MSLVRLQNYQLPEELARAPVLGPVMPPIASYFKVLQSSLTPPNGVQRSFVVPETFESGKLLVYVSELKLSPNSPVAEYTEDPETSTVQVLESLTPEALDTVRFTFLKFGVYNSLWRFNALPTAPPDGSTTTFYTKTRPFFDRLNTGGLRPYLWAWVCGVLVKIVGFVPPQSFTLPFAPNPDEVLELLYLEAY